MEFYELIRILLRGRIVLSAGALVGLVLAAVGILVLPQTYTSESKVFVYAGSGSTVDDLRQGSSYGQQVVKSFAEVATTPIVLRGVIEDLGLQQTSEQLAPQITAVAPPDSTIIEISATSGTPQGAIRLANAVSSRLSAAVKQLTPTASSSGAVQVAVIQPGSAPTGPTFPNPLAMLAGGVLLGLVAGALIVLLRWRFRDRVWGPADLNAYSALTTLGEVPLRPREDQALGIEHLSVQNGDFFDTIWHGVEQLGVDGPLGSLTISSVAAGEGKSSCAAGLAIAAAIGGREVVVVTDATDLLEADAESIEDALQPDRYIKEARVTARGTAFRNIWATSLMPVSSDSSLTDVRHRPSSIEALKREFDLVIVDAHTMERSFSAAADARSTEGVLMVCASGEVARAAVVDGARRIERTGGRLLGVVFNKVPVSMLERPLRQLLRYEQAPKLS